MAAPASSSSGEAAPVTLDGVHCLFETYGALKSFSEAAKCTAELGAYSRLHPNVDPVQHNRTLDAHAKVLQSIAELGEAMFGFRAGVRLEEFPAIDGPMPPRKRVLSAAATYEPKPAIAANDLCIVCNLNVQLV